jgi:predicted permease
MMNFIFLITVQSVLCFSIEDILQNTQIYPSPLDQPPLLISILRKFPRPFLFQSLALGMLTVHKRNGKYQTGREAENDACLRYRIEGDIFEVFDRN